MNIQTNELVAFGKHLLTHLEAPIHPDDVDWEFLLRQFGFNKGGNPPGLMFLNWSVATHFKRDPVEVRYSLNGRKGEDNRARQVSFYIALSFFNYGPTEVAQFYYNKSGENLTHATIIHGRKNIEQNMETDKKLKRDVDDILYKLTGYEYNDKTTWEGRSTTGVTEDVSKVKETQGDN